MIQEFAGNDLSLDASRIHAGPMALLTEPYTRCITLVSVDSLIPGDSPRIKGLNVTYAEMLADLESDLPPILVQRSSMRVIDGMHRLHAAQMRGKERIGVQFFDCDEDDAFLLAVAANITHGMPLTITEKRAAAARIVRMRPDASNRWIAEVSGLAAATVAAIRQANTGSLPVPAHRVGRDGRIRPLNATGGRRLARDILTRKPDASLRQVAREAGISVGTVRDVKEKIRLGIDPVQTRRRISWKSRGRDLVKAKDESNQADFGPVLERLRRDPSLRYTDTGKSFLRWLFPRLLQIPDWESVIDYIPPRWICEIMHIAYSCAEAWAAFAEQLEQRSDDLPASSPAASGNNRLTVSLNLQVRVQVQVPGGAVRWVRCPMITPDLDELPERTDGNRLPPGTR